ncbi:hypothetical protein [Spongiactinospora sp. 9N601]|uniref:hypothetical protein n=1 Tax=Spongiactinospora sp. 9N601 TaxID=3375149 RepID=UPI0037A8DBD6
MKAMRRRVLIWASTPITGTALAGTGIYLARVGLADADTLTSALGLAAALAGLATAIIGLITTHPTSNPPPPHRLPHHRSRTRHRLA